MRSLAMRFARRRCEWDDHYTLSPGSSISRDYDSRLVAAEFNPPVGLQGTNMGIALTAHAQPHEQTAMLGLFPVALAINSRELRALSWFVDPHTPRDVLARVRAQDRWTRATFGEFVYALASNRVLAPITPPVRPRPSRETRGILIIAIGPEYERMARALVKTIRAGSPNIAIAIAHDKRSATFGRGAQSRNEISIPIQLSRFHSNGRFSPYLLKLHADVISPFDRTIYIDADTAIFPYADLDQEINRYEGCDVAPCISTVVDPRRRRPEEEFYFNWTMKALVGVGIRRPLARVHSYYFYFRKTSPSHDYFARSREIFRRLAKQRVYQGHTPDEVAMSLASAETNAVAYSEYFMPIVERANFAGMAIDVDFAFRNYLGVTMIGREIDPSLVRLYNLVVDLAGQRTGASGELRWGYRKPESLG